MAKNNKKKPQEQKQTSSTDDAKTYSLSTEGDTTIITVQEGVVHNVNTEHAILLTEIDIILAKLEDEQADNEMSMIFFQAFSGLREMFATNLVLLPVFYQIFSTYIHNEEIINAIRLLAQELPTIEQRASAVQTHVMSHFNRLEEVQLQIVSDRADPIIINYSTREEDRELETQNSNAPTEETKEDRNNIVENVNSTNNAALNFSGEENSEIPHQNPLSINNSQIFTEMATNASQYVGTINPIYSVDNCS